MKNSLNDAVRSRRIALRLVGVVVLMGALSYAAVPFYDWFCRVTGFGGTTSVAATAPDTVLDRTLRIRFDASLERGMPWQFKPMVNEMEIKIGETGLAFYEAYNPTDKPVAGSSSVASPTWVRQASRRAISSRIAVPGSVDRRSARISAWMASRVRGPALPSISPP